MMLSSKGIKLFLAIAAISVGMGSSFAASVSILNVDFNTAGPTSPTTSALDGNGVGFRSFNASDGLSKTFTGLNPSLTTGSVTVTLNGLDAWRDRGYPIIGGGSLSGAYKDLYRDFVSFAHNGATSLTLTGLAPNTDYDFTVQSFDMNVLGFQTLNIITQVIDTTPAGSTNGLSTNIYYATNVDPSASIVNVNGPAGASGSFNARSNAAGMLAFAFSEDTTGFPRINGFELSANPSQLPEPASLPLLLIGLASMAVSKRRHMLRAQ